MKKLGIISLLVGACVFAVISYGFIDPNFPSVDSSAVTFFREMLTHLVYRRSWVAAGIYMGVIGLFFAGYYISLRQAQIEKIKRVPRWLIAVIAVCLLSFPALSYDIFNYILTAKVAFFYTENPYIVMPIEIANEPMLAFTRAANKLALYGPVWIALSAFPHLLGSGSVLVSVFSFKLFAFLFYTAVCYIIYRKTKRWDATLFFAANPLVLIEVLANGHNDIVMMAFALAGLILWQRRKILHRGAGLILFAASVFVKGATIALLPVLFPSKIIWEKKMAISFWLMFIVFLLSPLREEMYPWYAVWWLVFAALVPLGKKLRFIHGFSFWFSLGLMLRYIPWIGTREYGGVTPLIRIILMMLPVAVYLFLYCYPILRRRYTTRGKRL